MWKLKRVTGGRLPGDEPHTEEPFVDKNWYCSDGYAVSSGVAYKRSLQSYFGKAAIR